jgi:hypothetical protein
VKKVKFEDIKAVTRSGLSKKDRQYNGQKTDNTIAKRQTIQWPTDKEKIRKDKQGSTDHYTENKRSSNTNPNKNVGGGRTQVLRKGKQFLLHL